MLINKKEIKMKNHEKKSGSISLFAAGIQTGGLGARLLGYIIFFIPTSLVYVFGVLLPSKFFGGLLDFSKNPPENIITSALAFVAIFTPIILIFFFWERSIRKFRRKHGLSIYKNVREELEQMEFNKMYEKEREMEERAKAAYEGKKKKDGLQD